MHQDFLIPCIDVYKILNNEFIISVQILLLMFYSKISKAAVIECLSGLVQEDVINDKQPRIPKECRQQLRMQLYQQRENIRFDPALQKACAKDIKQFCFTIEPGNSQVLECLATQKNKLSDQCHKQLFKVRHQEFQDSSTDFMLLNSCRSMIRQFCYDVDRAQALDCLKNNKDQVAFDAKCKNVVIRRMIEQNTDYRFNGALQSACSKEIADHCSEVSNLYQQISQRNDLLKILSSLHRS